MRCRRKIFWGLGTSTGVFVLPAEVYTPFLILAFEKFFIRPLDLKCLCFLNRTSNGRYSRYKESGLSQYEQTENAVTKNWNLLTECSINLLSVVESNRPIRNDLKSRTIEEKLSALAPCCLPPISYGQDAASNSAHDILSGYITLLLLQHLGICRLLRSRNAQYWRCLVNSQS